MCPLSEVPLHHVQEIWILIIVLQICPSGLYYSLTLQFFILERGKGSAISNKLQTITDDPISLVTNPLPTAALGVLHYRVLVM